MTVEKYFEEYTTKYHEMKKALKRYLDAKSDFYYLSGTKYDDMPKGNSKSLGLDDLMSNIEELNITYPVKERVHRRKREMPGRYR